MASQGFSPPVTCVSSEPHDDDIRDYVQHYMGCIEISERRGFFDPNKPLWKKPEHSANNGDNITAEMKSKQITPEQAQAACRLEIRRARYLRKVLANDPSETKLVDKIMKTRAKWVASEQYKSGMKAIRTWKPNRNRAHEDDSDDSDGQPLKKYDPELDINVHILKYKRDSSKNLSMLPHEKMKVKKLLETEDSNPLRYQEGIPEKDTIKYVHLPANNMEVSIFPKEWVSGLN